jgi:zinc protease
MRRLLSLLLPVLALTACEETPPAVTPPQPKPTVAATATVAPAPADPAPVTDGDVTVGYAAGVQVVVKRIPGAEISAMQLYIRGGARTYTAADAGIARLALAVAASGGTAALDKDAYHRRLAALGSDLWSEAGADFASLKAKTPLAQWDDTFALLADVFLRPALPASDLEVQRQRQLATLRREQSDPDASLDLLVNQTVFKGHPFSNRAIGTEESVSKLTLDAVNAYLAGLREAGRLVLVTVGDVDPAHVLEKVKGTFGALPRGAYAETPFPALRFDKPTVSVTERKLSTNYIEAAFPAPGWSSPDFADAMVAMSHLHHRVFEEVRTKRNLSYAPAARLSTSSSVPYGFLYVTAVDPNATIKVMFDEVKKLQSDPIPEKELTATKSVYLTRYLMGNESTDGQASMLAGALLLGGDWKLARTLPDRIRAVTPAGVQAYAKKYLGRLQVVVLGDPTKIDKALFGSM